MPRSRGPQFARLAIAAWLISAGAAACTRDTPTTAINPFAPPVRVMAETLVVWRDSLVSTIVRPTFDATSVYFLGKSQVYSVNKTTGALRWTTALTYPDHLGDGILQGFGTAIAAGLVIIGDIDVFGLDPATGAIRWRFAPRLQYPSERSFQRLATDGKTVFVGGVWGNVYAVDAATGAQRWISHVTALPDSFVRVFSPVLDHGVVFFPFCDDTHANTDGGVAAFDAATGRRLWSQTLARQHGTHSTEVLSVALTPTRAVAGVSDGFVYGLDRTTGSIVDTVASNVFGYTPADSTLGTWFHLAATDKFVAVGVDSKNLLLALDANDLHHVLWKSAFAEGTATDIVLDSARVYTSWAAGQFSVSDALTGKVMWWIEREQMRPYPVEIHAAPALDADRIYVGADREVYAFKRR
jgi:outer membrane protein assembly factor BamB